MIEAISFLDAVSEPSLLPAGQQGPVSSQFGQWFSEQLNGVNAQLTTAEHGVQQLAAGAPANLHQVMIDLEQAKLALQLAMQVRSKVLEAYQEIMRMPL